MVPLYKHFGGKYLKLVQTDTDEIHSPTASKDDGICSIISAQNIAQGIGAQRMDGSCDSEIISKAYVARLISWQ